MEPESELGTTLVDKLLPVVKAADPAEATLLLASSQVGAGNLKRGGCLGREREECKIIKFKKKRDRKR